MPTVVFIDGAPFAPEHAVVSVFDRGFLYGDSVFETIRTYSGRCFALTEHVARLARSARSVFIDLPLPAQELEAEIERAVAHAGNPESYVRVMITRGSGPMGLDTSFDAKPRRVIIAGPLASPPPESYEHGIDVITYRTLRTAEATEASSAKIGNYLVAVLALREARAAGAAEALIVDGSGNVGEGASSNVFAVIDGQLCTPPETAGILPGITRAVILELAEVSLRPLSVDDLGRAEEIFITSSIRELLPVVHVDGAAVGDGKPGPRARELHRRFLEKVSNIMAMGSGAGSLKGP